MIIKKFSTIAVLATLVWAGGMVPAGASYLDTFEKIIVGDKSKLLELDGDVTKRLPEMYDRSVRNFLVIVDRLMEDLNNPKIPKGVCSVGADSLCFRLVAIRTWGNVLIDILPVELEAPNRAGVTKRLLYQVQREFRDWEKKLGL